MDEATSKLECLKLSVVMRGGGEKSRDILQRAEEFFKFVGTSQAAPPQSDEDKGSEALTQRKRSERGRR